MDRIPELSYMLIEKLDETTPERCYDINLSKDENIFYSGQRSVINSLLLIIQQNKENNFD